MINRILILILLFCFYSLKSQEILETLSLEDAIKIGIDNNLNIKIAKQNKEIAKLQNNFGNTGMSPQVSLNGLTNIGSINSEQNYTSGLTQKVNGAIVKVYSGSINVNWTIFDGLKMFTIKKRFDQNESLSALQLKDQVEILIYNIMLAYFNIVRINELIKSGNQNISLYEERRKIAELKFQVGSGPKGDLLLAKNDENKAKTTLMQLKLDLLNAKIKLNNLIVKPISNNFITTDTISLNYNPDINDLRKNFINSNTKLLIAKQNEKIAALNINEIKSNVYPIISFNSNYTYSNTNSQAGFILQNIQSGLYGGITASWNLFNGQKNKKLISERKLQLENIKNYSEQIIQEIDGAVYTNYSIYNTYKGILELELQNLINAKELVNLSLERYKSGRGTLLETVETYRNLEDVQLRYMQTLYNIKIAEIELLKANGTLIK